MASHRITHVIFDFDGVLLDSERAYSAANSKTLELYGKQFNNQMKAAMMGRSKESAILTVLEMCQLDTSPEAVRKYDVHYESILEELLPAAPELPGATALIEHFHSEGIPLGICTGSSTEEFEQKTRRYQHWLERIPSRRITLTSSDPEVEHCKPHPQPYEITMRRFAPDVPEHSRHVLVFEDSINGARSAIAAGMTVVMVPQEEFLPPDWEEKVRPELEPKLAEIIPSLEYFDPAKYGLPAFKRGGGASHIPPNGVPN